MLPIKVDLRVLKHGVDGSAVGIEEITVDLDRLLLSYESAFGLRRDVLRRRTAIVPHVALPRNLIFIISPFLKYLA